MSNLPVTVKEYENSVLVADFIRKAKEVFDADGEITDFHFAPKINGYEISYVKNRNTAIILIKFRKCFGGMKIKTNKNKFLSRSAEDNTSVISAIF